MDISRARPLSRSASLLRRTASPGARFVGWSRGLRGLRLLWLGSIIVPVLIFAAAAYLSWRSVDAQARSRLDRIVDMLHEHALRSFETQEAILEAVSQRLRGLDATTISQSADIHKFLEALGDNTRPTGGIVVIDPNGIVLNGNFESAAAQRIDLSDREYVQAHKRGYAGTYIGEVIVTRPQNFTVFSFSRKDPETGYVVATSSRPQYFESFYRSVTETDDDVVALIREDGAPLARVPSSSDLSVYAGRYKSMIPPSAFANGRASALITSPIDGIKRYYAFRRVGTYPVVVTYGLSTSVLWSDWLGQIAVSGVICLIAALLLMFFTVLAQRSVKGERRALAAARMEAERRAEAEARLRHSQRVDALGQIVGGVAHDFNNVVSSIIAGARMVTQRADDAGEVRKIIAMVQKSAERGARLTERMLSFARREQTHTEFIDVNDTLKEVVELLGNTLGSGYRISLDMPPALPPAVGDQSEFDTVIVNLVLNARDAMPSGGNIEVRALESVLSDAKVEDDFNLEAGHYLVISISDDGIGMDPETLARVGEAFFTTKDRGKGTGLGLAMARGFAEHSKGALHIESERNRGTAVTLWIAVAQESQA